MSDAGWHIDKRLSVSHLITTAALAASLIWWGAGMESRMALIEKDLQVVDQRMEREVERNNEDMRRIAEQLNRIEDRLERLMEPK